MMDFDFLCSSIREIFNSERNRQIRIAEAAKII